MWKIAQDGGFTLTNKDITNTLVAFAMQMYYENPEAVDSGKYLFTDVSVTGNHAVAGNYNRQPVALEGLTHRPRRCRLSYLSCQPGVAPRLPVWYVPRRLPDLKLEGSGLSGVYLIVKRHRVAIKVLLEAGNNIREEAVIKSGHLYILAQPLQGGFF